MPLAFLVWSASPVSQRQLRRLADDWFLASQGRMLIQARVSVQRVSQFLNETETEKFSKVAAPPPTSPTVGFRNASFAWEEKQVAQEDPSIFQLGDLNLSFPVGKLSLVVGPGKFAFLIIWWLFHKLTLVRVLSGQRQIYLAPLTSRGDESTFRRHLPPISANPARHPRSCGAYGYYSLLQSNSLAPQRLSQRKYSLRGATQRDQVPRRRSSLCARDGSRAI